MPTLLHHDPRWMQPWKRDQPRDRSSCHEERVTDPPAKQGEERSYRDDTRERVSNRNVPEKHARPEDGPDRCCVSALDGSLHVAVGTVSRKARRNQEDEQERGQEDAHGDGYQEVPLIQPTVLLNDALLQKRNDHETTAEGKRPRLQEKQQ